MRSEKKKGKTGSSSFLAWNETEEDLGDEAGFCGSCALCDGVDDKNDVCLCQIDDPHKDWRYKDNEPCPKWRPDKFLL